MATAAITFDFHNTIAQCDEWFDIEVRGLVSGFLRWQSADRGLTLDPETLWSADEAYRQLRQGVREHGNELAAEACVAVILDELNLSYSDEEISLGVHELMWSALASTSPIPGAVETIRELKKAAVALGIVSSAVHHPFLLWTLERFGIEREFDDVTTSASAGFYKSRPEIYWSALTALDARPEASIHIGDSHRYDVGGARKAGMRTVLITTERIDPDVAPLPDLTLESLVKSTPSILELISRPPSDWIAGVVGSPR
jgi:HAD superfamily hydrolase (TIGR01509 family)